MNWESLKEKQVEDTEVYHQFSLEIDYYIDFFDNFSELIFFNGRVDSFITYDKVCFIDTSLIDSSIQTLKSIKLCCSVGSIADANALIRKFRDDLMLYVYIMHVKNCRKSFLDEDVNNIDTQNPEKFTSSILRCRINSVLTEDEQAVEAWLNNSVGELKKPIKNKLSFENYMKCLRLNDSIAKVVTNYNLVDYWETLRRRLNDYVHNNGVNYTRQNFIDWDNKNLEIHLKNIITRVSYISSFFLVLLLMVESSLISSTDYIDHLECDLEPPESSQYSIAPFVQDFIDSKLSKLHPELKQFLQDNNVHGMKIE